MRIYAGRWKLIAVGAVLMLIASAATLIVPFQIREAVGRILLDDGQRVSRLISIIIGLTVTAVSFEYLSRLAIIVASESSSLKLRRILLWHVMRLPLGFYREHQTGYLMGRIRESGDFGEEFLQEVFAFVRNALILVVAAAIVVANLPTAGGNLNWGSLLVIVGVLAIGYALARRMRAYNSDRLEKWAQHDLALKDVVSLMPTIRSFSADRDQYKRVVRATISGTRSNIAMAQFSALARAVIAAMAFILPLLGLVYGGAQAMRREMSFPDFMTLLIFLGLMASSCRGCFVAYLSLRRVQSNLDRLRELMIEPPPSLSIGEGGVPASRTGVPLVELRGVGLTYPGRPPLLKGVDLSVSMGQKVGLAGPNGSGKSTLFLLILRLEEPTTGQILINGRDVASIDPRELRQFVSVVPQNPEMISGTIRENILLGLQRVDPEELDSALRGVGLDQLVSRLPDGLETRVGENGRELSHGERKRIAVARCVLRRPELVLLDEATESLDEDCQLLVPELLERVFAGKAVIQTSHRPAELEACDVLYAIESNTIVAGEEVATRRVRWKTRVQ